jgi:hypothetical protein
MATKQKPEEKQPEEVTKYSVAELVAAGPSVFGVVPELMAGALHGKAEATKEEAKAALKKFLKAPAVDQQDEEKGAAN